MNSWNPGKFNMSLALHRTLLEPVHLYKPVHNVEVFDVSSLVVPSEVDDKVNHCCPIGSRHRNYYSEADDDIFV